MTPGATTVRSLVLHATETGDGAAPRQANQRYKDPRIALEQRQLQPLHPGALRLQMLRVGVCGAGVEAGGLQGGQPETSVAPPWGGP